MKRKEPVFWISNKCPSCKHCSPMIYTPDLLNGNIDCECQSKFNPVRKYYPCGAKWTVAVDKTGIQDIRNMLELAERQDTLYAEIERNRKLLGYK